MKWRGRRQSTNIEDRRGGGVGKKGGIGIGSIIIALILWKVFGVDPQTTLGVAEQVQSVQAPSKSTPTDSQSVENKDFIATVLADTEDVWTPIFAQAGKTYTPPNLVLFTGQVQSACGGATSASGPFYCPADQKVYLDTQFFKDMRRQMGITGEQNASEQSQNGQVADFAQAYVIAHEVGHHIQTILGISPQVRKAQAQASSKAEANQLSVRQELQADCFAGLWARKNHERTGFLDKGDIEEALDAAEKIGDDYLQKKAHGHSIPDSFTHGTSQQRQTWFYKGFESGDINACDTFSVRNI